MESPRHFCFFCGQPTDTYVICEAKKGRQHNPRVEVKCGKKVPVCEGRFSDKVYPSKKNLHRPEFWALLHPQVKRVE